MQALSRHIFRKKVILYAHLSKRQSDLKQNGTQEKTQFSSTVFNTLSHDVICFVASVSSKKHLLAGWNSLTANQKLLFNGFGSYHWQQNETHHVKGYGKLCRKMVSFLVYHFV